MTKKLTFKEVSPQFSSSHLEKEVLTYWDQEKIFERSLEQRKGSPLFRFYDGPPYATGKPHYGHVLQSAIKDTVLRYKTMQGYYVPRQVGWDCHGLPVEVLVEKGLNFKSKKDIEELGIGPFNDKCREVVFRHIDDFTRLLKRIGRWADYARAYKTLDREYMEKEWGVFKVLWDMGLVYKAFRSTAYCVRCGTALSNHEVAMGYKEKEDESVYVMLPVANQQLKLLIWTTTSWTLPGNAAVAFNPKLTYVTVQFEGKELLMAEARVKALFGAAVHTVKHWTGKELQHLTYQAPYGEGPRPLVPAPHVTADDGTGLVHIAPAFGEEDFLLGQEKNLLVLRTVDMAGKFTADVPDFVGQHIFKAGAGIAADLGKRGLLLKKEKYRHNYPFCWRCDTPLIYYALDTWFIKVTALKERMLQLNEQINWTPEHVKHGRFGKGLQSAPDWAVSRSRFWGVPMPVWECNQCTQRVVVDSVLKLQELAGVTNIPDLHRPYVDEITWVCKNCSGIMKRVPEVLDVWFDAGSMPYASGVAGFPADFIVESIEMTRAWFYFLHVVAVATKDSVAFQNVIASGLVFAEDGQKLSKRLKNYPEPEPTVEKYGADVLRLYLLASTALGEPYRFSERALGELRQTVYRPLWNVFSFFTRYARVHKWAPSYANLPAGQAGATAGTNPARLDLWVRARFKLLQKEVVGAADTYHIDVAARAFQPFIDDLSNWYVRRSRTRFQTRADAKDTEAAFSTLYGVLVELSKLLAPFMPLVAEEMYRTLTAEASVHLTSLPKVESLTADEQALLGQMMVARQIVREALKQRAAANIKVRQPLGKLSVTVADELTEELRTMIAEEVNVKAVATRRGEKMAVELDTIVTPELQKEGWIREIIRHGQRLRKEAGYALNERIGVVLTAADEPLRAVVAAAWPAIAAALQADAMVERSKTPDATAAFTLGGTKVLIGVFKKA